ncbi:Putative prophage lcu4 related protein [Latilactobacillus curvatus]|nr:Putative prophage lcu4 related protein [Latilactobacillus curvatus]
MYYMNQGSYKKEPDWQSRSDARLEKWLKQKKEEKRRSDERRILLQKEGDSHEDQKHTNRQ